MTLKRLCLTLFLTFLTLTIGMVSIHSPLNVNAENSALSQSGNGNFGEQALEQKHSSELNGQVVSGDSSLLSGNNLLCQNQDNSNSLFSTNQVCTFDEPTPQNTAQMYFTVFSDIDIVNFKMTINGESPLTRETINSGISSNFPMITISIPSQIVMEGTGEGHMDQVLTSINNEVTVCNIIDNPRQFRCQAKIPSANEDGRVLVGLVVLGQPDE